MNKDTKISWGWKDVMVLLIALAPVIIGALMYNALPEQLATHFDLHGNVNGNMSKPVFFSTMTLINLVLAIAFKVVPSLDPKRANYAKFMDVYELLRFVIVLFLSGIFVVVLLFNIGYNISMNTVMYLSLGALWIVFGNYMGRIRHNYFMGIRTPWTLASEDVWRKTHRLAAPLWVLCGLVFFIGAFIGSATPYLLFGGIIVSVAVPIIYSFLVFQKLSKSR
ncbi:SdpI family protein [Paenibacillus aestuarii]|uniref:SdpI family protein n=1 Tax=Paenibacillus aestuarii TaxID=516965 RepID=A0ABW0K1L0_9BACL|nr:SdpI family protein [Paenibacillus aestuarii]